MVEHFNLSLLLRCLLPIIIIIILTLLRHPLKNIIFRFIFCFLKICNCSYFLTDINNFVFIFWTFVLKWKSIFKFIDLFCICNDFSDLDRMVVQFGTLYLYVFKLWFSAGSSFSFFLNKESVLIFFFFVSEEIFLI